MKERTRSGDYRPTNDDRRKKRWRQKSPGAPPPTSRHHRQRLRHQREKEELPRPPCFFRFVKVEPSAEICVAEMLSVGLEPRGFWAGGETRCPTVTHSAIRHDALSTVSFSIDCATWVGWRVQVSAARCIHLEVNFELWKIQGTNRK